MVDYKSSVPADLGNDLGLKNLAILEKRLTALVEAEKNARAQGDQDLAARIGAEITRVFDTINPRLDQLNKELSDVSNELTTHKVYTANSITRLENLIKVAQAAAEVLEGGEVGQVKTIIEGAMLQLLESSQLAAIAARLSLILDGATVSVASAIATLWGDPSVAHVEHLNVDSDGIHSTQKLHFVDGATTVATLVERKETDEDLTLTYEASDFGGLGVSVSATETWIIGPSGLFTKGQTPHWVFSVPTAEVDALIPTAPDVDGDGVVGAPEGDQDEILNIKLDSQGVGAAL